MMVPSAKPDERKNGRIPVQLRLATAWEVLLDAIARYRANGDTNQAAAIALYAILSFIPLFILTLLLVGQTFGGDPLIQQKLIDGIHQFIPSFSGRLLMQFGQIEGKKDLLGWAGIVSLIWFSAMIFGAIETALNVIFRSRSQRNYFTSKLMAIAMIPLGWTVGILSVGITYVAAILSEQPLFVYGGRLFLPEIQGLLLRYLVPYLLTILFVTIVYKVIPSDRIDLKSALIGSIVFSTLMEIAKQLFTAYITSYTRYDVIFGPLEALVIFIFWVFYVSLILLFCAELISSYRRRDMILIEQALLQPENGRRRIDERLFRKFGRLYRKDEYIFREGEEGDDLFYILDGRVRLQISAGRPQQPPVDLGAGEYFGEMAALVPAPRSTSARCLEESHIAVINGETLRSLLHQSENVSFLMLKEFSNRMRQTNETLELLTRSWLRLMAVLYFLRRWPVSAGRDPVGELAALTGKAASEIRAVLEELAEKGVLTLSGGRVTGFDKSGALGLFTDEASA